MNKQNNIVPLQEAYTDELKSGTFLLHGQYEIVRHLASGGFGITYLAKDSLDRTIVIKECFPTALCCRVEGRVQTRSRNQQEQFDAIVRHFIREAKRLSKLNHPSIVGVHQVFEENHTAYMALDFINGLELFTILDETPERLTPELIRAILHQVLDAVSFIHSKGILHRDISPDNILLDGNNRPALIDFGAAREHSTDAGRALSALLAVKDGYSPQEFYLVGGSQKPSSDLYALGATFYHIVTGEAPIDSQQRLANIAAEKPDPCVPLMQMDLPYPDAFLTAIDKAMAVFPEDRFQSADEWLEMIDKNRRASAALARAEGDNSINSTIARIVEDTDPEQVMPGPVAGRPQKQPQQRPKTIAAPGATKSIAKRNIKGRDWRFEDVNHQDDGKAQTRRLVDLFGDPIEDVDEWMKEQNKAPLTHKSRTELLEVKQQEPQKQGLLRSLFGLGKPRRK